MKYYRVRRQWWSKGKGAELSEICRSWLLFTTGSLSPLGKLAERDLLNNEVLSAAVCLMLWSIASIQIATKYQKSAVDPNMFLVGFLYAATALDSFHSCPVTLKELEEALSFYLAVLEKHELNDAKLQQLYQEIKRDLEALEKEEKAQQERASEVVTPTPSHIKTDGEELSTQAKAEKPGFESMLEPIMEESTSWASTTVRSNEPETKERPNSLPYSHRTVEIPELTSPSPEVETGSDWQTNSTSIVPSLKRNFVKATLRRQQTLSPELLEDRTVCADSLVLQTLQVS